MALTLASGGQRPLLTCHFTGPLNPPSWLIITDACLPQSSPACLATRACGWLIEAKVVLPRGLPLGLGFELAFSPLVFLSKKKGERRRLPFIAPSGLPSLCTSLSPCLATLLAHNEGKRAEYRSRGKIS